MDAVIHFFFRGPLCGRFLSLPSMSLHRIMIDVWNRVVCFSVVLFGIILVILLVRLVSGGPYKPFNNDAAAYSAGAKNISEQGLYSFDGVHPTDDREPGYSFFLAPIYLLFGQENLPVIAVIQAGLYLLVVLFFLRELRLRLSPSVAGVTSVFLLLSPSIFNIVMTPYRESLSLSLLLCTVALYLSFARKPSWPKAWGMGLLSAALLLTNAPFLLFPLCLTAVFFIERLPKRFLVPILLIPLIATALWMGRNKIELGRFEFVGPFHTASFLNTRALQVQTFSYADPARCLWREYITRNLSIQNPYCYVQFVKGGDDVYRQTMQKSEGILFHSLPMFAWVALFGAIEFHFPYVTGWGHFYNIAEACATFILSLGVLLSIPFIWKRRLMIFIVPLLYNAALFALLTGLPRFRMVTFFAYAVLASVGYVHLFRLWRGRRIPA